MPTQDNPSGSIPELCRASVTDITAGYRSGALSPVTVTEAALAQAETADLHFNAFWCIEHDQALAAAKAAESRWRSGSPLSPIDGIPTTIKDIVRCQMDARYGSAMTPDVSQLPDAPSVGFLRAAGAVFLGLTNVPEFGWKAITDSPKNGPTLNPWNPRLTPGGSSGGAAAAAVCGAGYLHLGTDGGGSIRVPASFTNLVGHKPSFGRVAAYPASVFGTVAHIGPMARTVSDVAVMLNAMSGRDSRDWNQGACPSPELSQPVNPQILDLQGLRIGVWRQPVIGDNHPEVEAAFMQTVDDLEKAGAMVIPFSLPDRDTLLEVFYRHWYVGAANALSRIPEKNHVHMDPGLVNAAQIGNAYSALDGIQAAIARSDFGAKMDMAFDSLDFIVSPSVQVLPFEINHDIPPESDFKSWVEWAGYSFPINLSQQPACSVPCGVASDHRPMGLQIIGARGQDEAVLSMALTYEHRHRDRFLVPGGHWPVTS